MPASKNLNGVIVYLTDDDIRRLRELAKKEDRTLSSQARQIIHKELESRA